MAIGLCPHCAGTNRLASSFCQWCGVGLGSIDPAPPGPYAASYSPRLSAGAKGASRTAVIVVVLVVVVLIASASVGVGLLVASLPHPTLSNQVQVSQILLTSSNDACGLAGAVEPGFTVNVGTMQPVVWSVPNSIVTCSISSIAAITSGFFAEPATVQSFQIDGTTFLEVVTTISTPYQAFSGSLTINLG